MMAHWFVWVMTNQLAYAMLCVVITFPAGVMLGHEWGKRTKTDKLERDLLESRRDVEAIKRTIGIVRSVPEKRSYDPAVEEEELKQFREGL